LPPVSLPATTGLKFDWQYPEPLDVSFQLAKIADYLEHTEVLALSIKEALQVDTERRFEQEVDPDGRPWEPLVKPTDEQIGILRLTEEMALSAVSDDAWTATPSGVFFDASALPPYWAYHEQPEGAGGQRIPQRRFIGASPEMEVAIVAMGQQWLDGGVKWGRGMRRAAKSPLGDFVPIP